MVHAGCPGQSGRKTSGEPRRLETTLADRATSGREQRERENEAREMGEGLDNTEEREEKRKER